MKLYVGNLSFETSEGTLEEAFAAHGTVKEASVVIDRVSNRSRGFAFVTMSTREEGEAAIQAHNGRNLDGREITVNEARPMERRSAGSHTRSFR